MATLETIGSKVWGISVLGTGAIAEGIASLRQCISIILHTTLGSDPLRPLFGSRVYKYQDAPVNIAIPNIKASIIEALSIWEKRIKVQSVTHRMLDTGHVEFEIVYLLVDENLVDSILFNPGGIGGTGGVNNLLLQCIFPFGSDVYRNFVSFSLNNAAVQPPPPIGGFANTTEAFNWCKTNWINYGIWTLLPDRMLLQLNPGNYSQASLAMLVSSTQITFRHAARIPVLPIGNLYNINFNPNATGLLQSILISPYDMVTKEKILDFAQTYWSVYGTWAVEPYNIAAADFSSDFSDDFFIAIDGYELVLYSATVNTATLEVEII